MNEVAINRLSYTCPTRGLISAPAGVLVLVTHVALPGGYLLIRCACGEEHKVKFGA